MPDDRKTPTFPMCKLAEYSVTANSTRRRSLVRTQLRQALDDTEKRRWWHSEARAEIRRFLRSPDSTRRDLTAAANRLRDRAAIADRQSVTTTLLASARAIESFAPIADAVRNRQVIASAGQRANARIYRGNVEVVVAPDLVLLERRTENVVGAVKLHAVQEFQLSNEALLNGAAILYAYLQEHGDKPAKRYCTVIDVFSAAFESAPASTRRRMQNVEAACEEIEGWWYSMYSRVQEELDSKRKARGDI